MPKIKFCDLDAFTQGYAECAFFCNQPNPRSGEYSMDGWEWDSLTEAEQSSIIVACGVFQGKYGALLARAYRGDDYTRGDYSPEECAGHDYFYTSNGHGTGFWDRELGMIGGMGAECSIADALDKACRRNPGPDVAFFCDCGDHRETGSCFHDDIRGEFAVT